MSLSCPLCEVPLKSVATDGVTLDTCRSCGGTWYDERELSQVLQNPATSPGDTVDAPLDLSPVDCPKCRVRLESTEFAHDSGIRIRKCQRCRGVWLASGQLQLLSNYKHGPHSTDRMRDALVDEMNRSSFAGRVSRWLQSRWLVSGFIAAVLIARFVADANPKTLTFALVGFLFPLACVWYAQEMGRAVGVGKRLGPRITQSTPGVLVALGAWILILTESCLLLWPFFFGPGG